MCGVCTERTLKSSIKVVCLDDLSKQAQELLRWDSRLIPTKTSPFLFPLSSPLENFMIHPGIHECDIVSHFLTIVLFLDAVINDGPSPRDIKFRCCQKCHNALVKNKMPACAVSNGLFIGEVPVELQGLSVVEERLIAPLRVAANVMSIRPLDRKNPAGAKTRRLTSHIVTFPNSSIDSIAQGLDALKPNVLPNEVGDLPDMINVILLKGKGSSLPISREELVAQLRSVLVARRTICGVAIQKLKHIRLNGRLVIRN